MPWLLLEDGKEGLWQNRPIFFKIFFGRIQKVEDGEKRKKEIDDWILRPARSSPSSFLKNLAQLDPSYQSPLAPNLFDCSYLEMNTEFSFGLHEKPAKAGEGSACEKFFGTKIAAGFCWITTTICWVTLNGHSKKWGLSIDNCENWPILSNEMKKILKRDEEKGTLYI